MSFISEDNLKDDDSSEDSEDSRSLRSSSDDSPTTTISWPARLRNTTLFANHWASRSSLEVRSFRLSVDLEGGTDDEDIIFVTTNGQESETGRNVFAGWLCKQTVLRGVNKAKQNAAKGTGAWKKRFFILKRGCLYYYVDKSKETIKNITKIDVEIVSRVPKKLMGKTIGYQFQLSIGNKTLLLATHTESEMDAWASFISTMEANAKKEGWIMFKHKEKGFMGQDQWRVVWLEVKADSIEIITRIQQGYFPLVRCTVTPGDMGDNTFVIAGEDMMFLKADTPEQRMEWIDFLLKEIKHTHQENLEVKDQTALELVNVLHDILARETNELIPKKLKLRTRLRKKNPDAFLILSIDGGGMKGIVSSTLIERLTLEFPDLIDMVDMVAGCSNGAILALGLAFEHHPTSCRSFMEMTCNLVFETGVLANKMKGPKYRPNGMQLVCNTVWGDKKLKDATKKVVVPSFVMDNHAPDIKMRTSEPVLMHNIHDDDPFSNDSVVDVIMRTTAAPTFFPSYQQHVDGGLFAHDPSSAALALALSPKRLGKSPKDILLLALGTGRVNHYYEDPTHSWGYVQWLPKLTTCIWDGMIKKAEMECREILGDNYLKVDPVLEKEIPMDDPSQVPLLTEIAKQHDLSEVIEWIKQNFIIEQVPDQ